MSKYICIDCGREFDDPEVWEEDRGEFWGTPCTETVYGCPYCHGDYEEIKETEEDEEEEDDECN